MSYLHFREGDPRDFDTSFKGVELINIFIKEGAKFIEGAKIQGWGGELNNFHGPKNSIFYYIWTFLFGIQNKNWIYWGRAPDIIQNSLITTLPV